MASHASLSRAQAVAAVRRWVGTPYRLAGHVRGSGADCCTLLVEYLVEIGRASREEVGLPAYTADWFLHASSETYLRGLRRFGTLVASTMARSDAPARPGDIALFKVVGSKLFNHGAVVTAWPMGVHAQAEGVREVDLVRCPLTSFRRIELFNPFGDA